MMGLVPFLKTKTRSAPTAMEADGPKRISFEYCENEP